MKLRTFGLTSKMPAIMLLSLGFLACNRHSAANQPTSRANAASSSRRSANTPSSSPSGVATPNSARNGAKPTQSTEWIVLNNDRPIPVLDDFEQHFAAAKAAQARSDTVTTAIELRSAAQSLQPASNGTIALANPALVAATKNLNHLAMQAEGGKADAQSLTRAFGAAYDADLQSGMLSMRTDQWLRVYDEPITRISIARDIMPNDAKLAALELRKAKAYIDVDIARATGAYRTLLGAQASKLGTLAEQVDAAKVKTTSTLAHVGADTARVLAEYSLHNARRAWQDRDSAISAQWLLTTVNNLRQSLKWSSERVDPEMSSKLEAAENFASNAQSTPTLDAAEMSKQLDSTRVELLKVVAKATPITGESAAVAALN